MKSLSYVISRLMVKQRAFLILLVAIFPALTYSQSCTADFAAKPTSGCTPLVVEYTDASSGATSWSWNFTGGVPSSATGKGPHKVVYNSPGTFDAALAITCKTGTDLAYKKGYINATACCTADFSASPTQACPGQEVTFTDASSGAVSWSWHFNGGTPNYKEGKGPHKVVYNSIGTYDVSLEIKCASSGDSEYKKALIQIVNCPCKPDFSASPTSGPAPLTVVFTDRSTNAVNWSWSFPGGTPSSMQGRGPHTVIYHNPGDYNVSLQINCANGQDALQRQGYIHVYAVPLLGDYGDAPEGVIAYPSSGVIGAFPTCRSSGAAGFIRHGGNKGSFLGNKVDHEADGNAGACSAGSAYDQDELCYEADSGLWAPDAFTLRDSSGVIQVAPLCAEFAGTALGEPCETATWGRNISLYYNTDHIDGGAYINVLIDWNQDGAWGGSSVCTSAATPRNADEHVLKNFPVPGGTAGHLSTLHPPDFLIGPNSGYVWARMTITETPVSLPWDGSGDFDEGESEDYLLKIIPKNRLFDFGDAPFMTRLADNGAQHRMYQGIYLGATIDSEEDGQPDKLALGDDRSGRDDEDGVEFQNDWIAGDTAKVAVMCSASGMLKAWVDFNQDRDWDDKGEMVLDTQVAAGKNQLRILIPQDAKEDSTFARFRFSLQPIQGPGGLALDGEVEDYRILVRVAHYDYGDAPLPFPTSRAENGPRHLHSSLYFGTTVDWEANGTHSAKMDADDNSGIDDEDGIRFIPPFVPGYHFDYTVSLSAPGYVTAWIDFNNDGDWDDDWEQIQVGRTLLEPRTDHPGMPYSFSAYIPPGVATNKVAARFRISSTSRLPYTGPAVDGEVEDYGFPVGAGMDSLDWGDAPDPPYRTLAIHDGPRHIISDRVGFFGVDKDRDGMPSLLADGDDLSGSDDENHYRFITPLVRGHNAAIEFWPKDISILNGWIDFNADGDWDDPFEHCIQDLRVTNPGYPDTAAFKVPLSTVDGYSYARFRISKDAGISTTGLAVFGSVEDYRILLGRSSLCERDSLALVALYRSTNGDSWANRHNWLSGPLSTWNGVELDGCRVRAIRLPHNNLTGILPPEIGNLDAMETLDLSTVTVADSFPNNISGSLPAELGQCSALVDLNLSNNRFSGSIPAALGDLAQLESLLLQGNELSGAIPAELGHLSRLQNLSLNRNALEGEIPIALCGLANLQELYLSNNQLTGTIPDEMGRLSNLRFLILGSNRLHGRLPASLYTLTHLAHLGLYTNEFDGPLSADIGHLTHLIALVLYENQFEGELPGELFTLSQLQQLRLNSNHFRGVISPAISSLHELQYLSLEENDLFGAVPDELAGLDTLEIINLHANHFTRFPDISSLPALQTLQLQNNRLSFADIEPNMSVASRYYSYAPQDSLGIERDTTLTAGMPFELRALVDGTANTYQWQRNDVDLPGADNAILRIPAVAAGDIGSYICRITNRIAVDLVLYTRPIHASINGVTAVMDPSSRQPDCYRLEQNHPNPFNPETRIEYQLPQSSPVWLGVYNLQGQCVRLLVNEIQDAGVKHVVWDARSDDGKKMSSGIYVYRLEAGSYRAIKKMVLLQ
jgi:PKD repeat protein/Leucine-rich repeat (LRR) protein